MKSIPPPTTETEPAEPRHTTGVWLWLLPAGGIGGLLPLIAITIREWLTFQARAFFS